MSSVIETIPSLEGYFADLLKEALASAHVAVDEPTKVYLLQLTADFAQRDALYQASAREERGTPALFTLYEKAMTSAPSERFDAYRHLGDVALVVSGFFAPQIERSLVDLDYYVKMGGTAYARASAFASQGLRRIMAELSRSFEQLVEVFVRVAERTTLPVKKDLGALMDRWLRAPDSTELQARLLASGFVPVRAVYKIGA